MPRYTRKSYFDGQNGAADLTHSLVIDAADDADAIRQANKARYQPGTTAARLYDGQDRLVCELTVPRS